MFNNRCLRDFPSIYVCCCLNLTSTKILDCYSSFRNSSFSGFRLARVWKRRVSVDDGWEKKELKEKFIKIAWVVSQFYHIKRC